MLAQRQQRESIQTMVPTCQIERVLPKVTLDQFAYGVQAQIGVLYITVQSAEENGAYYHHQFE